ncbi:MAG TPA: cytochrome c3 family protein [Nitrospirota bacterium]
MKKIAYTLAALSIVVFGAIAIGFDDKQENPHKFSDNDCFMCHFTIPNKGDNQPRRFTDTISNLCGRCHDMSKSVSHEVDMVPSDELTIPKDMPLDEQGRMTCITCHDIHKPNRNPLTGEKTFFLRREVLGKNFCISCHTTDKALDKIRLASIDPKSLKGLGIKISHSPVMDRGHGFAHFEVLDNSEELDNLSLACLDCHDDEAKGKKTTIGMGRWRHASEGIGLSHPIGMDYRRSTMDFKDLVPDNELDKRIKLFNGKLGCCTCHNPYIPGNGESLVIGTKESYQDLCFACHVK